MEFTWKIENFRRLTCRNLYSEIFTVEGRKWRILLYPKGNNADCLSIYLDVADSATLPKGWSRYVDFSLILVNQIHPQLSISKSTSHLFTAKENDWGFTSFMSLNELYDQARGYLVYATVFIKAAIGAHKRMPKQRREGKDNKGQFEAEADNYIILKVARDEDLEKQIGRDIYFDLVDHDKVCSFRFQKQAPFILFKLLSMTVNCYAYGKSVEKAEALMHEIRDLGLPLQTVSYNVLLNLYYQMKDYGKLDALMRDMDENGVAPDQFTLGIRLSAYAATSDHEGLETTVNKMESDSNIVMDWATYCVLASGFRKARLKDKALLMLTKCETTILKAHERSTAYNFLLSEYAALGERDEVIRICELYKKIKIQNKGYISMMSSLLKFNDLEYAGKIFEQWESQELTYDARIPNLLIRAYCKKSLLEKAEDVMSRAVAKGGNPDALTWYHIGTGYIKKKQFQKAVELLRKAILTSQTGWKPSKPALAVCIDYLKGKREVQEAEDFIRLLCDKKFLSVDAEERLLKYVNDKSSLDVKWDITGNAVE